MSRHEAAPRCILCGSVEAEKISDRLRGGTGERFPMRPHRCGGCGLVFMHPLPDEPEQTEFYRGAYRDLQEGADYDMPRFHENKKAEARRRHQTLRNAGHLRGVLLEMGSSSGAFLELAAPEVEACFGVEPNGRQRAFCRENGLTVYETLADVPDVRFDVIVMFHVLEHLRDPVVVLRDLGRRLGSQGTMVVEVPNVTDVLVSRYDIPAYDAFYWQPAHNYCFSRDTLMEAARQAGLAARVEPLQRYSLSNHLHWAIRGEPGGQAWLADLLSAETEAAYARDLCRDFVCDTLWMVAGRGPSLDERAGEV